MKRMAGASFLALLSACAVSSQRELELDLEVTGTELSAIPLGEGAEIRLDRADLAFGPLSLCPGAQAGALCDTARLEWRDAVVIDALSPVERRVGKLSGMSGGVQSYMYDLGVVSLLGEPGSKYITSAAQELGGASLVLQGEAFIDEAHVPFKAAIVVESSEDNEQGVPVVRKGSTEAFSHEVTSEDQQLSIGFDPAVWVAALRPSDFVQFGSCSPGIEFICDGNWELRCAPDGSEENERNCAESGGICAPDRGCAPAVEFSSASRAYRSIVQALTAGAPPHFTFR